MNINTKNRQKHLKNNVENLINSKIQLFAIQKINHGKYDIMSSDIANLSARFPT